MRENVVNKHASKWFRVRMSDLEIKPFQVVFEYEQQLVIEENRGENLTTAKRSALYAYFPTELEACEFVEAECENVFARKRSELYETEKRLRAATENVVKAQSMAIQQMHAGGKR